MSSESAGPPSVLTGPRIDLLDIAALGLESGGGAELSGHVAFEPLELAGHAYGTPGGRASVTLRASAPPGGLHLKIAARVPLRGPCWRCLSATDAPVDVATHLYHEYSAPEGDELDSEYIADDAVDVARFLRDSVAEAMPQTILCRADCAGLCGGCGADLNSGACSCPEPGPDPRWGPLAELAKKLEEPSGDD